MTIVPPSGHLASQRRAAAASARRGGTVERSLAARTSATTVPNQVRRIYVTPGWVPSARTEEHVDPALEQVHGEDDLPQRPEGMIRSATWTTTPRARVAAAFLLVGFVAAAVATGSGLLRRQSTPTLALTLACLLGAAGVYALLVVLRPAVVELAEPWLSVRLRGNLDRFNLASPHQELHVSGRPGSRTWRLALVCPDGRRVVRLHRRMVDSRQLDVVVRYAQDLAAREHAARVERFNR